MLSNEAQDPFSGWTGLTSRVQDLPCTIPTRVVSKDGGFKLGFSQSGNLRQSATHFFGIPPVKVLGVSDPVAQWRPFFFFPGFLGRVPL